MKPGRVSQIDFKGPLPFAFDEFRETVHDHPPDTESTSFLAPGGFDMKHVVKALTLALAASLLMAATAFAAPR